jgi:hypothetical protein
MTQHAKRLSRRNFLLAAGAGSAAAVAAVVTSNRLPAPATGTGKTAKRGYHATRHVNNYYRTAKV